MSNQKSEVEQFYEKTQVKLGGEIPWGELPYILQLRYTEAVNLLVGVASLKRSDIGDVS